MGLYPFIEQGTIKARIRGVDAIMFKNVYDALGRGEILGIAPEGVSRFLPFMAKPLKTGPTRMALAAVEKHIAKDENYKIKILPRSPSRTARFRSDVVIMYGEPIVVDKTWVITETFSNT